MKRVWGLGLVLFSFQLFAADRVLLVGEGGWASCKQGIDHQFIAEQFSNLLSNLKRSFPNKRFVTLTTCTEFAAAKLGRAIPYRYIDEAGRATYGYHSSSAIHQLIAQRTTADTAVFLIGHSHGGWLAMKATAGLTNVWGLFSIEPISADECDVRDYLMNRSKRPIPRRQVIVAGCRQAPSDVSVAAIQRATPNWFNYHLDEREFRGDLHSSSIYGATNVPFPLGQGKDSHHLLGLDYRVWTDICLRTSQILGESRASCPAIQVDRNGRIIARLN